MGIFKRSGTTAHAASHALRRLRNLLWQRLLTEEQEDALLYRADPALMNALYSLSGSSHNHLDSSFDDKKDFIDDDEDAWLDFDVNDICVRVAALRRRLGLRAEPHL